MPQSPGWTSRSTGISLEGVTPSTIRRGNQCPSPDLILRSSLHSAMKISSKIQFFLSSFIREAWRFNICPCRRRSKTILLVLHSCHFWYSSFCFGGNSPFPKYLRLLIREAHVSTSFCHRAMEREMGFLHHAGNGANPPSTAMAQATWASPGSVACSAQRARSRAWSEPTWSISTAFSRRSSWRRPCWLALMCSRSASWLPLKCQAAMFSTVTNPLDSQACLISFPSSYSPIILRAQASALRLSSTSSLSPIQVVWTQCTYYVAPRYLSLRLSIYLSI